MPMTVVYIIAGIVAGGLVVYLFQRSSGMKRSGEMDGRINNLNNAINRLRYENQEMASRSKKLEHEVRKHADLAILLPELVKAIFSARTVAELSTYLIRSMNRLTGCECIALFMADRKGSRLGLVSSRGLGEVLKPPVALNVGEGHVGFVAETGRIFSKEEFLEESALARKQIEGGAIPGYIPDLAAPMMCRGVLFGVICLNDIPAEGTSLVRERLRAIAAVGAASMENILLLERFSGASDLDSDTGLPGESRLVPVLELELERVRRFASPLSVIELEIPMASSSNRFLAREAMMIGANYLKATMRNIDTGVRTTRDRIVLILPGTDGAGAGKVVQRLGLEMPSLCASEGEDCLAAIRTRVLTVTPEGDYSPDRVIDEISVMDFTAHRI
jgi:GGDEF domain-containing protein